MAYIIKQFSWQERGRLMSRVRRMFAGGNSSQGFHSFYHEIIFGQARRLFILKGGPGTGKSTLMKSVAEELLDKGYDLEVFHCSSDVNSLDAIAVPSLKVAIVDGTAPHVVEPRFPGCVERIINLGDYLAEEQVRKGQVEIVELVEQKANAYPRVYRLLKAAKLVYDDIQAINSSYMNFGKVNQVVGNLISEVFRDLPTTAQVGKVRRLFATAITPQGPVNELHSIIASYKNIIVLKGEPGTGKSSVVERVAAYGIERGFDIEAFHCPLDPKRTEHLVIKELNQAIITSQAPHIFNAEDAIVINLDDYLDKHKRAVSGDILQKNYELFEGLLDQVFVQLRLAKAIHERLEEYYAKAMDFIGLDKQRALIVGEMLALAKED